MASSPEFTIVIPAFNEAETIVNVVERALETCQQVIVVDDGSSDGTATRLSRLPVRILRHDSNQGKAASLAHGFREALTDHGIGVVTLDGDGQHRPEDIPKFLAAADLWPDRIIIGSRIADKGAFPPARYRANRVADFWISWASGYRIEDSQSGFRFYPRSLLETVKTKHGADRGFVFESEILINAAHAGFRSRSISIPALYAGVTQRSSHFRPVIDIAKIVIMVAGKLLSRGLYPQGLYRVLCGSDENPQHVGKTPRQTTKVKIENNGGSSEKLFQNTLD